MMFVLIQPQYVLRAIMKIHELKRWYWIMCECIWIRYECLAHKQPEIPRCVISIVATDAP